MQKALVLTTVLVLSACSNAEMTEKLHADATPANIRIDTANYFATSQRAVRVGNIKSGILGTSYQAKVSGKLYDCQYFKKSVTCSPA